MCITCECERYPTDFSHSSHGYYISTTELKGVIVLELKVYNKECYFMEQFEEYFLVIYMF